MNFIMATSLIQTMFDVGMESAKLSRGVNGMVNMHYLSSLGMLGTTQLNFICRSQHLTMERAHTRQRMTNNDNKFKIKQVYQYFDNPGLLAYAITVTLKFKVK